MTDLLLAMTRVWLLYSVTKLEMFVGKKQYPIADQRAWGSLPKCYGREGVIGLWISDVQSNWCVYPWEWRGRAVIVMGESFWWATVTSRIVTGWEKGDCALGVEHPCRMRWKITPRYPFAFWNMKQALWRQVNKVCPSLVYGPSVVPSTKLFAQFVGCAGAVEQ